MADKLEGERDVYCDLMLCHSKVTNCCLFHETSKKESQNSEAESHGKKVKDNALTQGHLQSVRCLHVCSLTEK